MARYIGNQPTGAAQSADEFLPIPTHYDDGVGYLYFGWETLDGGWLLRRTSKSTLQKEDITPATSPYPTDTFAQHWGSRGSVFDASGGA